MLVSRFFFRYSWVVYVCQSGEALRHTDVSQFNSFIVINKHQTGILHELLDMRRCMGIVFGDTVKMQHVMSHCGNTQKLANISWKIRSLVNGP